MTDKKDHMGKTTVSQHAIATIAFQSALESYGVVGMADKDIVSGLSKLLFKDPASGVTVNFDGDSVTVDMYIVVEYGTRISSVASSVANSVKFQVEKMIGIPVKSVNVHVRGLHISNTD